MKSVTWNPKAFYGLNCLTQISLHSNKLERLHLNMFSDLSSCTYLSLFNNEISEIEPGSFNGLGNLQNLRLGNNQLTALNRGMFQGLVGLKELTLNSNSLSTLHNNVFFHVHSIQDLSLEKNNLTRLPEVVFKNPTRPFKLLVHANPLQCDSHLCWLKLEELQGNITWPYLRPRCANGIDWSSWRCNKTGDLIGKRRHISMFLKSKMKLEIVRRIFKGIYY